MESAEAHVVLDMAEHRLYLGRACRSQALAFISGQVGSGLPAVFQQAEGDAYLAVAFGFGALAPQRAIGAVEAFVLTPRTRVAVVGGIAACVQEVQALTRGADKGIGFGIVGEVFGAELVGTQSISVAVMVGFLVEGVVLEKFSTRLYNILGYNSNLLHIYNVFSLT